MTSFKERLYKKGRNIFLDDLASPTFIRERVIVANIRRNKSSIVVTNLDFTGSNKSNMKYMMDENKQFEKNL